MKNEDLILEIIEKAITCVKVAKTLFVNKKETLSMDDIYTCTKFREASDALRLLYGIFHDDQYMNFRTSDEAIRELDKIRTTEESKKHINSPAFIFRNGLIEVKTVDSSGDIEYISIVEYLSRLAEFCCIHRGNCESDGQTGSPVNSTASCRQNEGLSSKDTDFHKKERISSRKSHCNNPDHNGVPTKSASIDSTILREVSEIIIGDHISPGHKDNPGRLGRNGS